MTGEISLEDYKKAYRGVRKEKEKRGERSWRWRKRNE